MLRLRERTQEEKESERRALNLERARREAGERLVAEAAAPVDPELAAAVGLPGPNQAQAMAEAARRALWS